LYRTPVLYGLGLIILLYVGIENGMGGWTTEYVQRTVGFTTDRAAMVTSGFWLALTLGRMLSAGLGLRLKPTVLLAGATALAMRGGAAGVLAWVATATGGCAVNGFCWVRFSPR
jgi:fucose permease